MISLALAVTACAAEPAAVGERVAGVGQIDLEWSIRAGGQVVSCVDAGATEVRIDADAVAGERAQWRLSCYAGIARTGPLAGGTYDVTVALVGPGGDVLDAIALPGVEVDGFTPLGAVAFEP
ncbi:MAG: hypothetical protein D6689_15915 [Deltaproteobacteria bacterium]|nr:MAG: hypothetical protein D6689_15915 [Deltaproteobacteria bacterium]